MLLDEEDGSEESDLPVVTDIHSVHCLHCFAVDCASSGDVDGVACTMTSCACCGSRLHECKLPSHLEICTMVVAPCLNAWSGCLSLLRRDRLFVHLPFCPASNVVCGRERARASLSKDAKKLIKLKGKNHECCSSTDDNAMDVSIAHADQAAVLANYGFARSERVRRRDRVNRHEPVLPLRDIFNERGELLGAAASQPSNVDSSDEERKEEFIGESIPCLQDPFEEAKLSKKKAMFANCYMCHVAPGQQHFHTLGREDLRWEDLLKKKQRRVNQPIVPFYKRHNLLINLTVDLVPELTVKGDNILLIRNGGTLFIRKCLATLPRSEWGDHVLSQHADGDSRMECMIVRCPQWSAGCEFTCSRLRPFGGEMIFQRDVAAICYRPHLQYEPKLLDREETTEPPMTLDTLPAWVLLEVSAYLSGINLRLLSLTCRSIRETLKSYLHERAMVDVCWRKTGTGRWIEDGFKWSFPLTERAPQWTYGPASELSTHLSACPFALERTPSGAEPHGTSRIPIVPEAFLSLAEARALDVATGRALLKRVTHVSY